MSTPEILMAIAAMIFASTGFWTLVNNIYTSRSASKRAERRALLGLLHEKLAELSAEYIDRGYISRQEYEDLRQYIYDPYRDLGGNGTGEKLMQTVDRLPIR